MRENYFELTERENFQFFQLMRKIEMRSFFKSKKAKKK